MSRLLRISILALVALWLPVTLHCRLEAAGFFVPHDDCAKVQTDCAGTDCKDDACPTVEDTLYKDSTQALKVVAPDISLCFVLLELPAPRQLIPALSPVRHAVPLEIAAAWQFIHRAAPPARAPSLNA
jgi:hypothetical protein